MAVPAYRGCVYELTMLIQYFGIGFGGWSWYVALMFGAVICATDPVAVVSLLKELEEARNCAL